MKKGNLVFLIGENMSKVEYETFEGRRGRGEA